LDALPNGSPTCLRIGDWYDNRLVDRSRMNREVHVRVCERLRGKFPRSTRLSTWVIFGFLARYAKFWYSKILRCSYEIYLTSMPTALRPSMTRSTISSNLI
jgi:hypothetical protein